MRKSPKTWEQKTLGEVCLNKGQYGSGAKKVDFDGNVRYVRITDIDDDGNLKNEAPVSPSVIEEDCFLEKEDLLFARSGSVGRTYLHQKNDIKYQFAGYLIRFKINQKLAVPTYVFYFTKSKSYLNWVESIKKSGTLSNINAKEFASFELPIHPLPVQKRIAANLFHIDELRQKRRQADELSSRFLQSLFVKMFGDPETNPKGWERTTIGEVAQVGTGGTPSTKIPVYYENGTIRWMKSGDVDGIYTYEVPNRISKLGMENSNAVIHPIGSVMLAMSGQGKTRGQTTVLKNPMACSQSVAAIIPREGEISSEYLILNLKLRYLELRAITGINDRSGLNLKIIRSIPILKPPLSLQKKFALQVVEFEEFRKKQEESGQKLELLFKSMMSEYFSD